MTSYLGSLAYKSWKLTEIMPNSLKLLKHYILSNAPQKIRQRALKVAFFGLLRDCSKVINLYKLPYLRANAIGGNGFQNKRKKKSSFAIVCPHVPKTNSASVLLMRCYCFGGFLLAVTVSVVGIKFLQWVFTLHT